jgi:hypothetical protein
MAHVEDGTSPEMAHVEKVAGCLIAQVGKEQVMKGTS